MAQKNRFGIGNIFVSDEERKRRARAHRRTAMRALDRHEAEIKREQAKVKDELQQFWSEAKQHVANGDQRSGLRSLKNYSQMIRLEDALSRQVFYARAATIKLKMVAGSATLGPMLVDAIKGLGVDPEAAQASLDKFVEWVDEGREIDTIMDQTFNEVASADAATGESMPSEDQLLSELFEEIKAESTRATTPRATESETHAMTADEELEQLRERLRKIS